MKNLKKLSRNRLKTVQGGGNAVCGMTCSSGKVISMHHCDSCAPMTGGAGMGCVAGGGIGFSNHQLGLSNDIGGGSNLYIETC